MTSQDVTDKDEEILIELRQGRGVIDVSRVNERDIASRSAQAFNSAMITIQNVAQHTTKTIQSLNISEQPDTIEITFGLKLTADAKALIANAGIESQIEVKLIWNNEAKKTTITN